MDLTHDQQEQAFNHLGSMLLQESWGDMDPVSWLTARYSSVYRPDLCGTMFILVFIIEPHHRLVDGYRQWIEAREVVAQAVIPDRERWAARDIQSYFRNVRDRMKDAIEDVGVVLYEHDPRIGFLFDAPDARLPKLPLFDRRGPPWLPKWRGYDYPPPVKQTGCPLCAKEFHMAETPMWGGSNLGWVHSDCWGEGMKREFRGSTTVVPG